MWLPHQLSSLIDTPEGVIEMKLVCIGWAGVPRNPPM